MANKENLPLLLNQLSALNKSVNNPKILWEEVKIIIQKTQEVEDKIMKYLAEKEASTKEVGVLSEVFDTRERVWDIIQKIENKCLEIKEKTYTKKEDV